MKLKIWASRAGVVTHAIKYQRRLKVALTNHFGGSAQLRDLLRRPDLQQFFPTVSVDFFIPPLESFEQIYSSPIT
jgi:hypothetical protein